LCSTCNSGYGVPTLAVDWQAGGNGIEVADFMSDIPAGFEQGDQPHVDEPSLGVDPRVNTRVEAIPRKAELGPMASALRASRREILQRWLQTTRQQPFHAAHPQRAVADHIPSLFDALVSFLERSAPSGRDPKAPLEATRIRDAALAHARDRFAQGLDPQAVLAEFRILRQEIGRSLRRRADAAADPYAAELLVQDAIDGSGSLGLAALEAHEAERSRLRAELAAIVDSSSDAILSRTRDGVIISWNRAAERMYGYSDTEAIGQRLDDVIPPERREVFRAILDKVFRGEYLPPYEAALVRCDGKPVPVSVSASPIRDASGAIVAASFIMRDITDQKRFEHALQLRSDLLEAAHEAIFAWSLDTSIIFWNRGAESQYGWTSREAVGQLSHDLLGIPQDQVDAFSVALEQTGQWEGELSHMTKDGRGIVVQARLALVEADAGQYVVEASRDVTEQRRIQHEAEEEVRVREQVLAVVAHDLRVPLTTIKGTADLIQQEALVGQLESNRLADQAARISSAAAGMASQIAEVLDAARLRAGRPLTLDRRLTDLVSIANRLATAMQAGATRHTIRVESVLPQLFGVWDTLRLERVLGNLLTNAIKYSPDGGPVTIHIHREERGAGDADWGVLAVRDCGIGIPAPDLGRVFERYHRGANVVGRFPGEGIGLSGALHIVEQHGGTIDVQSQEGRGSTFTVRLPLKARIGLPQ
jgi:PAS domain S-box-containing protein